jgi:hypothetical protein
MEYGSMLGESFSYAKDAVIGKWMQWLLLVIATVLLCIPLMGYTVRVLRGDRPAPEVTDWGVLIVDGIKYLVISIVYAIPALVILVVTLGSVLAAIFSGEADLLASGIGGLFFGLTIFLVVAIICALFGTMGLLRFARTGSLGEAFNFAGIREFIGRIGWGRYILALLIIMLVQIIFGLLIGIIASVPVLGVIVQFLLVAPIVIFEARYLALVYESA